MKKNLLLAATIWVLSFPLSAGAYMVELSSHEGLSGGGWVEVLNDGTNAVTFNLSLAEDTIADMRGFSFSLDGLITSDQLSYTVNSLVDANNDFTPETVITNWPVVSPSAGMKGTKIEFDFGAEFGDGGIGVGQGDIREISLTFSSVPDSLLLNVNENNFGMRLMSVLDPTTGDRSGSLKLVGGTEVPPPPSSVPEPVSALVLGLGLAGIAGFRKRSRQHRQAHFSFA
jgi:hypothetical protein